MFFISYDAGNFISKEPKVGLHECKFFFTHKMRFFYFETQKSLEKNYVGENWTAEQLFNDAQKLL